MSTIDLTDTTDSASNGVSALTVAGGIYSAKRIRAAGMITALGGMTSALNINVLAGGITVTGVSSFVNSVSCYGLTCRGGGVNVTGVSTFANSVSCYGLTCTSSGVSAPSASFSGDVTCGGNITCSTVPTSAGNLCNKLYVDNVVTNSVANVVTAVSTTDYFSISGLTFTGLSKELTYSKVGKFVFCNLKVTWTLASGTAAAIYPNVTVGTPFPSLHRDRWISVESQWYQNALPIDIGKY